jgi:hypothetical protein
VPITIPNWRGPFQSVHQHLKSTPYLVRYLNAVEVRDPKRRPATLTLEACVETYAPELLAGPFGLGLYNHSLDYVRGNVMGRLYRTRLYTKRPLTQLVEDAIIAWLRKHVYGIMPFGDGEQAVFIDDNEVLHKAVVDRVVWG